MAINNQKTEPLEFLLAKHNFEINAIGKIVTGEKYTAILLKNGNIGVSANLGTKVNTIIEKYKSLSIDNHAHRIVLNAYFNALLNNSHELLNEGDIFDVIDFEAYKNIIMIGLFKPIVQKFEKTGIPIHIFDYRKENEALISMKNQQKFLKEADSVILTSTSIANNTFLEIVNSTKQNCDIFLLGPSSIITNEMFNYNNIKMIFGTCFSKYDERVLKIIDEDGGTRDFSKFASKKYISHRFTD